MASEEYKMVLLRTLTKAVIFLLERWVAEQAHGHVRTDIQEANSLIEELEAL